MSFIFKITTTTSPQTFVIPCVDEGTFNATVDYGDGTGSQTVTAYNDSNLTHSFATAGQYTITIDGTFPNVKFYDNVVSREALDEVVDLGDVGWVTFFRAFRDCTNLTTFNSGTADTSSVSNMIQMFYGCTNLTTLELSGFATSSVTTMQAMFNNCSSLTTLDLSSFDTSSVTAMQGMFLSCSSLTSLNVSNFDTSSVNNMQSMFNNCSSLTTLDIKHFDISSVTNGTSFLQNANNALTTTQYDELLEAWAAQEVQPNVPWHFGNAQYTVETVADWYSPRSNSSLSIINNKLVSIAGSTAVFGAGQQVDNLIVGNAYKIVGKATCSNSSATVRFRIAVTSDLFNPMFEILGTESVVVDTIFTATATTMYFGNITTNHAANDTLTIDAGITVKEITNYTEANAASEIEYSQENVFGSELVVNGDFDTDIAGWSGYSSSWDNGELRLNAGIQYDSSTQIFPTSIGKTYVMTGKGRLGTSTFAHIKVRTESGNLTYGSNFVDGNTNSIIFTANTTATLVELQNLSSSLGTSFYDNISVKEITNAVEYKNIPQSARELYSLEDDIWVGSNELVTNGDFDTDSDWGKQTGWTISGGQARIDVTSGYSDIRQGLSFTAGATVLITFDAEVSAGDFNVYLGSSGNEDALVEQYVNTTKSYSYIFKHNPTQPTEILIRSGNGVTGSIDNVSIKEIIEVAS